MRPEIRLKPQDFLVSHETRDPMRKPREAFGQIRHCCYFLCYLAILVRLRLLLFLLPSCQLSSFLEAPLPRFRYFSGSGVGFP